MVKRVSLVRRQPGASREEFLAHWTGPHAEIVRRLPGLRGMRLGIVEPTGDDFPWDGVGELWFDSVEAARAAFATEPHAAQLARDRAAFLGGVQVCFVREQTVIPPPASEMVGA